MDKQAVEQDAAIGLLNMLLNVVGDKFIALGNAIKNPDTPLTDLSRLAFELGLTMEVRFVPLPPSQVPNGFAGIPPVPSAKGD